MAPLLPPRREWSGKHPAPVEFWGRNLWQAWQWKMVHHGPSIKLHLWELFIATLDYWRLCVIWIQILRPQDLSSLIVIDLVSDCLSSSHSKIWGQHFHLSPYLPWCYLFRRQGKAGGRGIFERCRTHSAPTLAITLVTSLLPRSTPRDFHGPSGPIDPRRPIKTFS